MTKLILWLVCAVALIFATYGLMEHPGFISVQWLGYVMETSVAFCIGLIFALALAIYLVLFPFRWIRRIRSSLERKRVKQSKNILVQILTNILCDDLSPNAKLIKQFAKKARNDDELILMLKALSNDTGVYEQLIKKPKTEQAGWQGLINECIKRGEIVQASEDVENLLSKNPRTTWILKEAFNLFILNEEWKKALNCLETLNKNGALTSDEYAMQKAVLLVKLNKGVEAFRLCPALPAAALAAARSKPQKAEKIYRLAWQAQPSFEVYQAYVKLYAKENSLAQYKHVLKLCEQNKNAKLNALVIADAALKAKLWGEAKKELNGYLANYPLTINVASQMAQIEIEANHNMREAQKWIEKMSAIERGANYTCTKCGHKTDTWTASCPICNTFTGLKAL